MTTVHEFPKLYKKSSDGKLQEWSIWVVDDTISISYGDEGGKLIKTSDTIKKGKNIGKSNETTPEQQAFSEAQSKWTKQIERKGYVPERERALAGESNAKGGLEPMLAEKFFSQEQDRNAKMEDFVLESGHKIIFPALMQPKLDGIRCIATLRKGKCTLWTRTREEILSVPHINHAYEVAFGDMDIDLDGELYNNDYADDFERIVEIVRSKTPIEGHEIVQHHLYDLPSSKLDNEGRVAELAKLFSDYLFGNPFIQVPTIVVNNLAEMLTAFRKFRDEGYEGGIIRNRKGRYVNTRTTDLQKVVETITAEFPILGIAKEGRGKLQGHVGSFSCLFTNGKSFSAKMKGSNDYLKELFDDHSIWEKKMLTVRYRTLTRKNKVPRFPVGLAIRDYE